MNENINNENEITEEYIQENTIINDINFNTIHNDIQFTNSILLWSLCVSSLLLFVLFVNKIFSYFE